MKLLTNEIIAILFSLILFLANACDNKTKVMDSKSEINQETQKIEEEKNKKVNMIDSLDKEIKKLSDTKNELSISGDFAETEIYNILKKSYLDHIIIGSKNFNQSKSFFHNMLGFEIKEGKKHKNGTLNFFIEFGDSSEIEFMSLSKTDDKLTREYNRLLENEHSGFQFAIRTNEIIKLRNLFTTLSSNYIKFNEYEGYTTLSQINMDQELPLFFIQIHKKPFNTKTNHLKKIIGVSAVWLSTKDIKKSAKQFVDFGFSIVDRINVGIIPQKTVLIRNDNFEIILIEADEYEILGLTVLVSDLDDIQELIKQNLKMDLKEQHNKRGKSIFLNPSITNSILFEFLEKTN